jgi:glycosyltransferase involved in cell wall biosynthesis
MTPRISIITPVFNPPAEVLRSMLRSVRAQTSAAWEHVVVDDGSTAAHVRPILAEAAAQDERVRVRYRAASGGIVAASNDALQDATHEFVGFLDHDDELHPEAVARVGAAIRAAGNDVDYLYTDEDKIDESGRRFDPFLKPDWSPERFRGQMYTCHFSVARHGLVRDLGYMQPGLDGSQDWDLVFRVTERARRIVHVPEICYHWRVLSTSVASDAMAKPWAHEAARRAIGEHLRRTGVQAEVGDVDGYPGQYRIEPRLRDEPLVSIIIPTAGRMRQVRGMVLDLVVHTVRSIVRRTRYPNYEIVVVADTSVDDRTVAQLREIADERLKIVPFAGQFSFSAKINLGALHSAGDHLLLCNDDVEILWDGWRDAWPKDPQSSAWIESLLMYSAMSDVGAAGAKLYFADGRIQHAGIVTAGNPDQPYRGFPRDYPGYFANAILPGNYRAVTGACLMTRRDVFDEVGGFSTQFPVNYQDVDYGMKVHTRGARVVFTPEAELFHYEGSSRSLDVQPAEVHQLHNRWGHLLTNDPYYHPRFIAGRVDFVHPPYAFDGRFLTRVA